MSGKNGNHGPNQRDEYLRTCPLCKGNGKIQRKPDDTDICNSDTEEVVCPLCEGRGKVKYLPRALKTSCGCRTRKMSFTIHRPYLGRGARPSLGRYLLFSPETPVSGYVEGDMIPNSQLVPGYAHSAADDLGEQELDNYHEDGPLHSVNENGLVLPDGLTYIIGDEFGTNLAIVLDSPEVLQPDPNLVGSISRGRICYEHIKFLWPPDEPALQLPVTEPDLESDVRVTPVGTAEAVNQYRANPSIDIEGPAGPDPTSPEHGQPTSAASTSILPPEIPDQQDPLDITGLARPIEPDINTDIIGQTW